MTTWADVEAAIVWRDGSQCITTLPLLSPQGVSQADRSTLIALMQDLYNQSSVAASVMNAILDPENIRVASHTIRIAALSTNYALTDRENDVLGFNLQNMPYLWQFNDKGELVPMNMALQVAHELVHLAYDFDDLNPMPGNDAAELAPATLTPHD